MASSVGKIVGDHLYVHVSALDCISPEHQAAARAAMLGLDAKSQSSVNVVKIHTVSGRVSLLAYPTFDADPFPVLSASWTQADNGAIRYRSYEDSTNPPILHRKELLVPDTHPQREAWQQRTRVAEELGLFDNVRVIGFLANWERLIAEKSYCLHGGEFVPIGNAEDPHDEPQSSARIQRHLTALSRSTLSAPVQQLLRHALLSKESVFFDYGCGRGDDVAALTKEGFKAAGWDPFFASSNAVLEHADAVNLGFVINVIEDPAERVNAVHRAFMIATNVLVFGVMLDTGERQGRSFADGVLTARGTFQKYYTQDEIKDFVEQVLEQEVFMVAPGIGLVFKNKLLEQRFLAGRYRIRGLQTRLLQASRRAIRVQRTEGHIRMPRVRPPTASELREAATKPVLDSLWAAALDLGRWPAPEEAADIALGNEITSLAAAVRLARRRYDMKLLQRARDARIDDLCLHFAMQQFEKRPKYKELPPSLRLDVAEFFGTYAAAQAAGIRLLMQSADTECLTAASTLACAAGIGWLQGEDWLQVDMTLVERLPAVLRCYVGTGLVVAGPSVRSANIVKLHLRSRKVSFFEYRDYQSSPLPRLTRRVKVNLSTQRCDVFDYGERYPKPVLYRKSRYMHEEQYEYAEQLAFDEALENIGVLEASDEEFGPNFEELQIYLSRMRLELQGMSLVPSTRVPLLATQCGRYLTYRHFIECGETWCKLQPPNRPERADSYNALHGLATQVIDPVIEYFGGIEITYGFCSHELSRRITARVAPKLDQHSAEELTKTGQKICSRGGAACDFIVKDEDMFEVARWIALSLPFDRMYFYGPARPLHVSWSKVGAREVYALSPGPSGRLLPKRVRFDVS